MYRWNRRNHKPIPPQPTPAIMTTRSEWGSDLVLVERALRRKQKLSEQVLRHIAGKCRECIDHADMSDPKSAMAAMKASEVLLKIDAIDEPRGTQVNTQINTGGGGDKQTVVCVIEMDRLG